MNRTAAAERTREMSSASSNGEGTRVDLAKMFHELRNPFAAIHTAVSLIGEIPDSTPLSSIRRQLQLIQDAAERGVDLLQDYEGRFGSNPPEGPSVPPTRKEEA